MLDPKHMRRDPAAVRASLGKKGFDLGLQRLARLDSEPGLRAGGEIQDA